MGQQDAAADEQVVVAEDVALTGHGEHQAELGHRGVAQQAPIDALNQGEEVGADEADDADAGGQRQPLRTPNQQQLVHGEQGRRARRRRDHGREGGMGRLVYVQGPAIGREGLQLGHHRDKHEEESERGALHQLRLSCGHAVDVEGAGGVVGEDDAHQQQDSDQLGGDQELEAGPQGALIAGEQDQAAGGDHLQLEKDEQIEQVAGEDDAVYGHGEYEQHRHGAAALLEHGIPEIDGREQPRQVDQQGQDRLRESHAEIDRKGWLGTGGENLHRRGTPPAQGPHPAGRHPGHEGEGREGYSIGTGPPFVPQQTQQKGRPQADRNDENGAYHFSSLGPRK